MPELHFTANLTRHVEAPSATLPADTVNELLGRYFEERPDVRGYVLDDQGHVRHHVKIIVDGLNLRDRQNLTDTLKKSSKVYVLQALSGG